MKKGYIESIESGLVYILYEDKSYDLVDVNKINNPKIDYIVIKENYEYKCYPPEDDLNKKIKNVTKRIFRDFSDKK